MPFLRNTSLMCSQGHMFVHHSLAHVNRELVRRLMVHPNNDLRVARTDRRGRFTIPELRTVPNLRGIVEAASMAGHGESNEIHVQHQWPPRIKAPDSGRWVWIQPWELGSIPQCVIPTPPHCNALLTPTPLQVLGSHHLGAGR